MLITANVSYTSYSDVYIILTDIIVIVTARQKDHCMSGRPTMPIDIAKSADHKVFITESEKVITRILPIISGKSGSDFIREGFLLNLKIFINENPEMRKYIEEELQKAGLSMPLYLRGKDDK